ncbi:hypothetical protein BV25DRAFT_1992008 [Artomyces pyxidatus]|uniref:Uncharacterized protein n=1 Tax=Artomyces pyxidatus TaxID=48021 RepID=A0ACB8T0M9_9AGAM|nr:hypothetical protein BV25DRAFT_1992008 [Artomyces pyxidatus]
MGFFSSRRSDAEEYYVGQEKPVVGIIRSRFYGKTKAKAREQAPTSPPKAHSTKPDHLPKSPKSPKSPSNHLRTTAAREESTGPNSTSVPAPSTSHARPQKSSTAPAAVRASTDAMTMVLAQRLNELASANAEGLLDDDEYRALRQNLFERLASTAVVPTETPVVPNAGPSRPRPHDLSSSRPASTINRESIAPSLRSRTSVSSTMTGIFRRATGRKSASTSHEILDNDSTSLFSVGSTTSNALAKRFFSRSLSKQASEASLRSDMTSMQYDTLSISSRFPNQGRGASSTDPHSTATPSLSRSTTRSTRRLGKAPPPPSAFPGRPATSTNIDDLPNDEELTTAKDIRAQIESVEAEGRRLMDAFNGLELTTLTKQSKPGTRTPASLLLQSSSTLDDHTNLDPTWLAVHERKSIRTAKDSDGMSIRSTTSVGTNLSAARSPTRVRPLPPSPLVAQPVSLGRKSSFSSVSSRGRSGSSAPMLPPLSASLGRLTVGSTSSINLTRSSGHLPLEPVAEGDSRESFDAHHLRAGSSNSALSQTASAAQRRTIVGGDDGELAALELEMADIRRRRTEVMSRYDERLEYLRAKLKGAELHEKLLRR